MPERLILLPGWGFDPGALEPLCRVLAERAPRLAVEIAPLPRLAPADAWLDALDRDLPEDSWLAGWSLGGMLAAQLAARRGGRCRGLIGIAGNPCFRARDDWPAAMPGEIFDTFRRGFALDAGDTLKRFSLLCSRGGSDPRALTRQLQTMQSNLSVEGLDAGLQLLAQLDNREVLRRFSGPQLHLFGERDALVPVAAAEALRAWLPRVEVKVIGGASHGLPLERAAETATALLAFMGVAAHG